MATAYPELFNANQTNCILSESLASYLSINLGDQIRITFTRGSESNIVPFTVVGIAGQMPGFSSFKSSQTYASGGGVMISQANYEKFMQLPTPTYVEKIFIKVDNAQVGNVTGIEQAINNRFGNEYGYNIESVEAEIASSQSLYNDVSLVFDLILGATVIICIFGLLASTYSTIFERRREIAVLRTLGLRGFGINTLFSLEAIITFLTSATAGSIIGYITAFLLVGDLNVFTESPQTLGFPWQTVLGIFTISIIILLIGLALMLRKVRTQNIIDIYRETT
jgi:ABC-type antimicrobial peptide transport system permease subunit